MASLGLGDLVCRGARYRSHWPLLASEGQVSCHQLPCSWRLEKVRGTHLALGGRLEGLIQGWGRVLCGLSCKQRFRSLCSPGPNLAPSPSAHTC